ncbi:chemotaxis signal transduction protein [Desulfuromonas soudanensis]|uniref:Chemotaxis signal transduction protein n=1 Tax=Desulfuromonas soudanensis TaxID=1603606 RepID=A0A0M5IQZ7_9BACT|nr:chemotaxis protein CheW [Desulfuromonas soudanensis]ALC15906.1 chemotaxis signal transduction protein [Desulfuromonas soudanensis]
MGLVAMKLVFRIAGVGFSLPLENLIEVREGMDGVGKIPPSASDRLELRGDFIPLRDLRRRLALPDFSAARGNLKALILAGSDGPWGILVDRVEGIFSLAEFKPKPLPLAFGGIESRPYDRLELWRDEPLVVCDVLRLETGWGDDD